MSEMRWYALSPVDAWFFRDGRPFNRGEDAQSSHCLFPPHATTVGGGLRASLARGLGWDGRRWTESIRERLGGHDSLGPLALAGPFLTYRDQGSAAPELLFPMPTHILGAIQHDKHKNDKAKWVATHALAPSKEPITTDLDRIHVPVSTQSHDEGCESGSRAAPTDELLLTAGGMAAVASGRLPTPDQCVPRERLSRVEARTGIARDPETHAVTLGDLYSPNFVRLDDRAGLIVGVSGLTDQMHPEPLFPLGGESRLAACDSITAPQLPQSDPPESGVTAVIALTPCRFSNDRWYGAGPGDPASLLHPDLTGDVVCAVIDRPIGIGGWKTNDKTDNGDPADQKKPSGPAAMQPYVPAGSVWWLSQPPAQPLTQIGDRTAWGFGRVLVARPCGL